MKNICEGVIWLSVFAFVKINYGGKFRVVFLIFASKVEIRDEFMFYFYLVVPFLFFVIALRLHQLQVNTFSDSSAIAKFIFKIFE